MTLAQDPNATARVFERGLLSSRVAALLGKPTGSAMIDLDRAQLAKASQLIAEMLGGARVLSTPSSPSGVTSQSIASLGAALTPLQRLLEESHIGAAVSDAAIVDLLSKMQQALDELVSADEVPPATSERDLTRSFFSFLSDSLLAHISHSHRGARSLRP